MLILHRKITFYKENILRNFLPQILVHGNFWSFSSSGWLTVKIDRWWISEYCRVIWILGETAYTYRPSTKYTKQYFKIFILNNTRFFFLIMVLSALDSSIVGDYTTLRSDAHTFYSPPIFSSSESNSNRFFGNYVCVCVCVCVFVTQTC